MKAFNLVLAALCFGLMTVHAEDVEARVNALLARMTLEEKLSVLGGDHGDFSTVAVPRLDLPKLIMADGPQGVRNYGPACQFPSGAALAATWDLDLASAYGHALALEARARGVHILLGPGVNIVRVPVNGRNFEYFGEDPWLTGQVAEHYITGLQTEGVAATIKHFAANNQETFRDDVDVEMDDRTLHEIYSPAFRRAVEAAHVRLVMSAYNRFRGEHCTHSDFLQNVLLNGEWNFPGLLISDWGACHETTDLARGLDLEMGHAIVYQPDKLKAALTQHEVAPERVDDAVRRLLRLMVSMGFLYHPQKRPELPLNSPASSATALQVARGAVVLLKNRDSMLPLDRRRVQRLAVYGPNAVQTPAGGGGSGGVHPFRTVSFLDGIRAKAGPGVEVISVPDVTVTPDANEPFPMARATADGPPGFRVHVKMHDPEKEVDLPVQNNANLSWKTGELPLGIPAGVAEYLFDGVLVAPEDGDWELFTDDHSKIIVEGVLDPLRNGGIIHVRKGKPLAVRIRYWDVRRAKRPAEEKSNLFWVSLRPPQLPDLTAARQADAAVVCVGFNPLTEAESDDRAFALPEMQSRLIKAVTAANPRTIVTNNSGAGVAMADWIDPAAAVLQTWYLGQEGGTALAEVLFGDVNPSGHLPDSFDRAFADNPAAANYPGTKDDPAQKWPVESYKEGLFMGYRGYDRAGKSPLFPFGYGLSYTTFEYSDLKITQVESDAAEVVLHVKNTGLRAGAEVVQLYVGQPKCAVERPVRELKAFAKVVLQPGEVQVVTLHLSRDSFAFWHPVKRDWTIDPAPFVIEVGDSSRNLPVRADFDLVR